MKVKLLKPVWSLPGSSTGDIISVDVVRGRWMLRARMAEPVIESACLGPYHRAIKPRPVYKATHL